MSSVNPSSLAAACAPYAKISTAGTRTCSTSAILMFFAFVPPPLVPVFEPPPPQATVTTATAPSNPRYRQTRISILLRECGQGQGSAFARDFLRDPHSLFGITGRTDLTVGGGGHAELFGGSPPSTLQEGVQGDRGDDRSAGGEERPVLRDTELDQPGGDRGDDQGADHRADDRALAARKGGAADDRGGDHGQLESGTGHRIAGLEVGESHDPRDRAEEP